MPAAGSPTAATPSTLTRAEEWDPARARSTAQPGVSRDAAPCVDVGDDASMLGDGPAAARRCGT